MSRNHPFTLLEILIVATILALSSVIVLPRLLKSPQSVLAENAKLSIEQAFSETAVRARATGLSLQLTLDPEEGLFQVSEYESDLPGEWIPPAPESEESMKRKDSIIEAKESYPLHKDIQWLLEEMETEPEEISFCFFPDGQASGTPLRFLIGKQRYQCDVDCLSGNALITEVAE